MTPNAPVEQIKTEFNNLMMVNFATLDFIFKNRIGAGGVPGDVLDALEVLHNKCISEMNEMV